MKEGETKGDMRRPVTIFERHPKKTLLMIAVAGFILVVFGLENYLEWKNRYSEKAGIVRYVRLRENPPLTIYPVVPNAHYMKTADNFVQERHRLRVDEQGFVYPSRVHERPDFSIVFLGGSTTECLYVEEENRFPFLVGRFLERKGLKVNSYNSGVAGNDTLHSINILLNKIIPLRPDMVVIMHNINDLSVLLHEKTYWNNMPTRSAVIRETPRFAITAIARQLKNVLVPNLYMKIRDFVHVFRAKLGKEEDEFARSRGTITIEESVLVSSFRRNLQMMLDLCRTQGITPVLMTEMSRLKEHPEEVVRGGMGNLPNELGIEYSRLRGLFNLFNQTIREVGRKNNVAVIDLAQRIPQEQQYIYDVIHLTDKGSKVTAEIIAQELEKHVPKRERTR